MPKIIIQSSLTGLVNALDSSDTVTVTDSGISITMTDGMPKVYYLDDKEAVSSDHCDATDHECM